MFAVRGDNSFIFSVALVLKLSGASSFKLRCFGAAYVVSMFMLLALTCFRPSFSSNFFCP